MHLRLAFSEACEEVLDFDLLLSRCSAQLFQWAQADYVALILPPEKLDISPVIHLCARQPLLPQGELSLKAHSAQLLKEKIGAQLPPETLQLRRSLEVCPIHALRDGSLYPLWSGVLQVGDELQGLLILFSFTDWIYSARTKRLLELSSPVLARAIHRAGAVQILRDHADHDPLTKAANRRGLSSALERESSRASRNGTPLSLLLIDLDYFKSVNDTHGHPVGDALLCAVCDSFREQLRASDSFARIGGDEFAILLPDTSMEIAAQVGERLIEQAAQLKVGPVEGISFSVGIAAYEPRNKHSVDDLFQRADDALYESKRGGRGRISLAS